VLALMAAGLALLVLAVLVEFTASGTTLAVLIIFVAGIGCSIAALLIHANDQGRNR
jgi:hypothetical protein